MHFPKEFLTSEYQDYSKTVISAKEKKMKNNVRLEKQDRNINFPDVSFDQQICQNDHFDFAFSAFWCTKTSNW